MEILNVRSILLTAVLFTYSASVWSADITLDDFTTGSAVPNAGDPFAIALGHQSSIDYIDYQTSIGSQSTARKLEFYIASPYSPYQPASLNLNTTYNKLILNAGYKVYPEVKIVYGFNSGGFVPMNLNLSTYQSLRVYFEGSNDDISLTATMWSNSSSSDMAQKITTVYASASSFYVDLPFSGFTTNGSFTLTDVDAINLNLVSGSGVGGCDWSITSIKLMQ